MKPTCNVCKKSFKNERGLRVHRAFKLHPAPSELAPAESLSISPVQEMTNKNPLPFINLSSGTLSHFVHYVAWLSNFPPEEKVTILEAVVQYLEREPNAK